MSCVLCYALAFVLRLVHLVHLLCCVPLGVLDVVLYVVFRAGCCIVCCVLFRAGFFNFLLCAVLGHVFVLCRVSSGVSCAVRIFFAFALCVGEHVGDCVVCCVAC